MPLKVNFSGTLPVDEGDYPGTFKKWSHKPAVSSDKFDQVSVTFEIEHQGEPRDVYRNYSLSPKALNFIKRDLISLGADEDDLSEDDVDLEPILNACIGSEGVLRISHRTYTNAKGQEVTAENVDEVMPAGTVAATWK